MDRNNLVLSISFSFFGGNVMGKTKNGKELGLGIRSDCKSLLVDILNRAVENGLLNKNPALGINPIIDGKAKQEKRILSAQETKLLLDSSKGGMMYPIFVVALGTGMRIGEILGLTWDCVDFEKTSNQSRENLVVSTGRWKDSFI